MAAARMPLRVRRGSDIDHGNEDPAGVSGLLRDLNQILPRLHAAVSGIRKSASGGADAGCGLLVGVIVREYQPNHSALRVECDDSTVFGVGESDRLLQGL